VPISTSPSLPPRPVFAGRFHLLAYALTVAIIPRYSLVKVPLSATTVRPSTPIVTNKETSSSIV